MKNSMATSFLSQEEIEKVTFSVQEAEKKSSGEIVPMIVSKSYSYPLATHLGALLTSIPCSLLITPLLAERFNAETISYLIFLLVMSMLYLLFTLVIPHIPLLHKLFIPEKHIEEEVQEGAITSFFSEQLYKTEKENGVLLYISVFERRVWILGDAGINAVIPPDFWNTIVIELTNDIKSGNRGQGICKAVEKIGEALTSHFPAEKDDIDELHNLIIKD